MPSNRYVIKGGTPIQAEKYASAQGWTASEWIYVGGHGDRVVVIDLEDQNIDLA